MTVREIEIDCYSIKFDSKPIYKEGSADNLHHYDAVYLSDIPFGYIPTNTIYDIAIYLADDLLKRVLIGSSSNSTTIQKTSFVIEQDRLVICCSDTVFCLSIPDLSLLWKITPDLATGFPATCFQIFKYQSDYIIHGELKITRINHGGQIVWQQGGADIFVTMESSEKDFFITDSYIQATDWEKRVYRFDYNGKLLV